MPTDKPTDNIDELAADVEARVQEEIEHLGLPPAPEEEKSTGGPDDPKFVLECLSKNEMGDGTLFAAMNRDRFVFEKTGQRWLEYPPGAHHWQADRMGRVVSAVEQVALRYQIQADSYGTAIKDEKKLKEEAERKAINCQKEEDSEGEVIAKAEADAHASRIERFLAKRKTLSKRVDRLRGEAGAKRTLFWAHSIEEPLAILGDEIDQRPMLFPCANGVIDLETGLLRPGSPSDWLVKSSPIVFPDNVEHYLRTGDNCPCPTFDKFFTEIHGDEEVAHFHGKVLGYSMTGLTTEHIITVAIGEGRNGKGTMFERILDIYGDLAWVISPELILEQRNARASQGPAADLMALAGRRLIIGSETDENRRISPSAVKQLTGGDRVKARGLHEKDEINILQTWKLFLQTNTLPVGLTKDFALLQRLVYIRFPYLFVDDPLEEARKKPALADFFKIKDRGLPQRLVAESPYILAWLVRKCLQYQTEGLKPPDRIKADIEQLRKDEDILGQFIEAVCTSDPENTELWCTFKDLYTKFEEYHKENFDSREKYIPSRKRITGELVKRGYRKENRGGQIHIFGLVPR